MTFRVCGNASSRPHWTMTECLQGSVASVCLGSSTVPQPVLKVGAELGGSLPSPSVLLHGIRGWLVEEPSWGDFLWGAALSYSSLSFLSQLRACRELALNR